MSDDASGSYIHLLLCFGMLDVGGYPWCSGIMSFVSVLLYILAKGGFQSFKITPETIYSSRSKQDHQLLANENTKDAHPCNKHRDCESLKQ